MVRTVQALKLETDASDAVSVGHRILRGLTSAVPRMRPAFCGVTAYYVS